MAWHRLRPLGQLRESFILAVNQEGLWIIDQHVAHERVLFERVLRQRQVEQVERQRLLMPMLIDLLPAQMVTFAAIARELEANGFEVEPFGPRTIAIKAAPAGLEGSALERMLVEVLEQAGSPEQAENLEAARTRIAASIACHAAIKVNTPLDPARMEWLLAELARTEHPDQLPPWPPHRPAVCLEGNPAGISSHLDRLFPGIRPGFESAKSNLTAEQLQAARAAHWRQKQSPILTLDDAQSWLEQHPLCLYLPRRAQLPAPAPSFVEACMGSRQATPGAARDRAGAGAADPPDRLRQRGGAQSAGRGGRAAGFSRSPRRRCPTCSACAPIRTGSMLRRNPPATRSLPWCSSCGRLWTKTGALTATEARETLGRELTEAAVLRALCELWQGLAHQPGVRGARASRRAGRCFAYATATALATASATCAGNRPVAAGLHVLAVGVRGLERRDRDLSLPRGLALAGAGSGARLVGHAADPFALHGRADLLLPGKRLAGVRRASHLLCPC